MTKYTTITQITTGKTTINVITLIDAKKNIID